MGMGPYLRVQVELFLNLDVMGLQVNPAIIYRHADRSGSATARPLLDPRTLSGGRREVDPARPSRAFYGCGASNDFHAALGCARNCSPRD